MTPTPPMRPTAVTLIGGSGMLACSCGEDVAAADLTQTITCPRCGRGWVIRVRIEREPDRSDGLSEPAD